METVELKYAGGGCDSRTLQIRLINFISFGMETPVRVFCDL
jgi:hypothetical protein